MNYFGAVLGILISLSFKEIHWITGGLLGWMTFALHETRIDLKNAKEQLASLKPKKSSTKKKATEAVQSLQKSISKAAEAKPAIKAIKAAKPAAKKKTPAKKEPKSQLAGSFFNLIIDFFKGDKGLVRLGVVILLIGISFLMKTITPFIEITPLMKVLGIALAGFAFIGAGHYLKKDKEVYGLSLIGTGLAVLFLDTYAAYFMFELLSYKIALPLTCVIGGAGLALSLKNNSLPLAVLALGGGFVAPILSGVAQDIPDIYVFAYYLILNAIVLSTAYYKSWRLLNILGFLSTFVLIPQWYAPQDIPLIQMMLATFFILYLAVSILFARKEVVNHDGYVDSLITFALPFAILAFNEFPMRDIEYGYAYTSASMALVYGFTALILQGQKQMQGIRLSFMALAAILGTITIPLVFDAREVGALWALEGAAAVWLGLRQGSKPTATAGIILQLLAGSALILEYLNPFVSNDTTMALANPDFISLIAVAAAGLFTGYMTRKDNEESSFLYTLWGMAWFFIAATREIALYAEQDLQAANIAVLVFAGSITLFQFASNKLAWKSISMLTPFYATLTLIAGIGLITDAGHDSLLTQFGFIAWPTVILAHYALFKLSENKNMHISAAAGLFGTLALISFEICQAFNQHIQLTSAWTFIIWMSAFAIPLWYISEKGINDLWPFNDRKESYQDYALPALSLASLCLLINALFISVEPGSLYVPLANPVEAASILVFWVLYNRFKNPSSAVSDYKHEISIALLALVFIFINTVLARTVHVYASIPYTAEALWENNTFLAATSILWTTIALAMVLYGARIQHRTLWLTGAGLICVVVGKLFLVDISQASMIAKTVSFIATGLMLVGVGYFSPIPPTKKST